MPGAMRTAVLAWTLAAVAVACGPGADTADTSLDPAHETPEIEGLDPDTAETPDSTGGSPHYGTTVEGGDAITTDVPLDSTDEAPAVEDGGSATVETPDIAVRSLDFRSPIDGGAASFEYTVPAVATRVPVPLLQEAIPPCVPLDGVDHDPCGPEVPPGVRAPGTSSLPMMLEPSTFQEIMEGHGTFFQIPHIVIRATVLPDTTRCDGYLIVYHDYIGEPPFATHRDYLCFADVRVNEYIVGEGPAYLTVALDSYTFFEIAPDQTWAKDRDRVVEHLFGNPAVRVAEGYEGREVILFLQPAMTRTVEAWVVTGGVDLWFVLANAGGPAVGEESDDGTAEYSAAMRYDDEVVSEVALDYLVASVKAAAPMREAAVEATTTKGVAGTTLPVGRSTTGSVRGLPFIVDRADRLRDFYIAEGAVYEGDNATVLPPPAPISPGAPTNIEASWVGDRLLLTWDPPGDRGEPDSYYVWLVWEDAQGSREIFEDLETADGEPMLEVTAMARVYGPDVTVQVRAENIFGTSDWSPIRTFTTPAPL